MDTKTVVKYVTYAVGALVALKLVATAPVLVGTLVVLALVNVLYVNR